MRGWIVAAGACGGGMVGLAAMGERGGRLGPARLLTGPGTVSPQLQALIGDKPLNPIHDQVPADSAAWKAQVKQQSGALDGPNAAMQARLGVHVREQAIGGVHCFMVTPNTLPAANRDRLLIHLHGGAYVLFPGRSGIGEAILMAGIGHLRVISVDYRMPPDFPYPAAMDDAMAVWRAALTMAKPADMAVFGTSTGGGMTLALVQRAIAEHLPLPAAIAPGTPWSDLSRTGDSLNTNEYVDDQLVTGAGWLDAAAKLYARGIDLKDPRLSPLYGDFHGFPPAILTTGTRDLFLSNTVRTHRKLREAGVEAQLQVFEGMSHAQYLVDDRIPETKEAFREIAAFFDRHLGKQDHPFRP